MLFSGIGVMVLRLQRTCSRQYGTYLSNKMVRLARSDWAFLVSIQLATYLKDAKHRQSNHRCHVLLIVCSCLTSSSRGPEG